MHLKISASQSRSNLKFVQIHLHMPFFHPPVLTSPANSGYVCKMTKKGPYWSFWFFSATLLSTLPCPHRLDGAYRLSTFLAVTFKCHLCGTVTLLCSLT